MPIKIPNLKKKDYPYKLLLEGNVDVHAQLYLIVETFKDEHLSYKHPEVKSRTIGELISHTLCTQRCYFTDSLVLEKKEKCECKIPTNVKEALEMIQENLDQITKIWSKIPMKELEKEFKAEWGQVMTKELALFVSIEHYMYHVGEICFIAGMGGFYQGTLG